MRPSPFATNLAALSKLIEVSLTRFGCRHAHPGLGMRQTARKNAMTGLLLVGILSFPAQAQVVDQQQLGIGPLYEEFTNAFYYVGQTFKPTANTVAGAGINLRNVSHPSLSGTLHAQLWSGVPDNPSSSLLASGSTVFTIAGTSQSFLDVFFSAVSVTPGVSFFLVFRTVGGSHGNLRSTRGTGDPYVDGGAWVNTDFNDVTSAWTDYGAPNQLSSDLTFREYSVGPTMATPEPASFVLLATGLVGVIGVASRKRQAQSITQ